MANAGPTKLCNIGRYEVYQIVSDLFRLDGGAMFGITPKVLWEKLIPADERNRIQLCTRLLLVRSPEKTILVDVGMGNFWADKERDIYCIKPQVALSDFSEQIDVVALTHLHFDHAGGLACKAEKGGHYLFEGREVLVHEGHQEHARQGASRDSGSFRPEVLSALSESTVRICGEGEEVFPGIRVHRSDGHTTGLQWFTITEGNDTLAYPSDLIPTSYHIHLPYIMGYDIHAEKTYQEKLWFLNKAVDNRWLVVFEHDLETPAGTIVRDGRGRFKLG